MFSTKKFYTKYFSKLSWRFLVLLVLFIASIILFALVTHEALKENEQQADYKILDYFSVHIVRPGLTPFMKFITNFASVYFLVAATVLLVSVYILKKNWKRVGEIAFISIGGFLINYFMKIYFHRLRPSHPLITKLENFSYPSGHATSGFIFYGLLFYLVWKTGLTRPAKYAIGAVLILFSLLIGFSRIYLRVHYPTDVVSGFCIGFAWLSSVTWLFSRLKKKTDQAIRIGSE